MRIKRTLAAAAAALGLLHVASAQNQHITGDLHVGNFILPGAINVIGVNDSVAAAYNMPEDLSMIQFLANDLQTNWGISATANDFYIVEDLGSNPVQRFRIDSNGAVCIGTDYGSNIGDAKLAVNGTIKALEVSVESNWADFVFEEDYELRSLEAVDAFISEHGHLPDIPSAETVQAEGLPLAKTQTLMMQKIEELTLYAIDKDKRVIELEKQNATLEQRLARLESLLAD